MGGGGEDALGRAIFEHALDAMVLCDDAARIVDVNPAAAELFGRGRAELVGTSVVALAPPEHRDACVRALASAKRDGTARTEVAWVRGDGTTVQLAAIVHADVAPGRHLAILHPELRDRAIAADRYRVLWQRARDAMFFIGEGGRILDANDAAVELYGWSREELLGMTVFDLRAPETREKVESQIAAAFSRGLLFETVHLHRNGSPIHVEVGSRATTIAGERVLLSVVRDVRERHAMQARLAQADRLASVGTLAAGVAHEINNPLSYAMTGVEISLRMVREAVDRSGAPPSRAEELLATALHGLDPVRAIVRDLKMLARTDDELAAIDVRTVLEACLDVAQHELRSGVRLVRAYGEVPPVRANEGRLAQVFLNLIVNAAQAVRERAPTGGTIRIETARERRGSGDGERVLVRVADDGPGIAPEILPHVFEAFVTTKPAGEGTGLGLYLSRSIVHELGGEIEVESEPGRGAAFTVTLPAQERAVPTPRSEPPTSARPRRARILLVDDEIAIGRALRAALDGEHDLVVHSSAETALDWLAEDARFDVVLTDVSMHGMSGLELLARLRERHPELAARTILITGGAIAVGRDGTLDGVPVLEKPFGIESLRARIAAVLDRRGPPDRG